MEYYTTIIIPLFLLLIGIVGLVSNGMVTWAILSNKRMRSTTINILMVNLTVADLLFIIILLPFDVIHTASLTWLFGELWCKVTNYLYHVFIYMNAYTVVLMSLDRLLVIRYPVASKRMRTVWNTCAAILGLWVMVLCCCALLISNFGLINISERYVHCVFLFSDHGIGAYVISNFIVSVVLPVTIITILYVLVFKKQFSRSDADVAGTETKAERHISVLVAMLAVVFIVSWAPLQILTIYSTFSANHYYSQSFQITHMIVFVLSRAYVCFNPILFFVMCKVFPNTFQDVGYCHCLTQKSEGTVRSEMIPLNMVTENGDADAT